MPIEITRNEIIPFIANLLVRTQSLRNQVFTSIELVLDLFTTRLTADPKFLARLAKEKIQKELDEALKKAQSRGHLLNPYERKLWSKKAAEMVDSAAAESAPLIAAFITSLRPKMAGLIKSSHIQALHESLTDHSVPTARAEALKDLSWSLFIGESGSFILGDIGPICRSAESGTFDYLPTAQDTDSVILPISHDRAIIGSVQGSSTHLDSELVNEASAAFSSTFFVSDRNSRKEQRYLKTLATKSFSITPDDVFRIFQDLEAISGKKI